MEAIQRFLLLIFPNAKGKTILAKDSISLQIGKELGKWVNAALFFMEEKLQSMRSCFILILGEKKGLQIKIFEGFTTEWAKFILQNREESGFKHDYDIVIGPVADAFIDQEIKNYIRQCGEAYLDESNLSFLVSRISQFGLSYIQYCFCTQKAINELIKD